MDVSDALAADVTIFRGELHELDSLIQAQRDVAETFRAYFGRYVSVAIKSSAADNAMVRSRRGRAAQEKIARRRQSEDVTPRHWSQRAAQVDNRQTLARCQ